MVGCIVISRTLVTDYGVSSTGLHASKTSFSTVAHKLAKTACNSQLKTMCIRITSMFPLQVQVVISNFLVQRKSWH